MFISALDVALHKSDSDSVFIPRFSSPFLKNLVSSNNLQVLRLFTERQSQMISDFGRQLESTVDKLKSDVALIVKKKREHIAYSKP